MWSERRIASAISRQTLARKCLVLVDNCNWTGHECDVLAVTNDLRVIDVEVKISRADLKADAKKDKWWRNLTYTEALAAGLTSPGRWDTRDGRVAREWPPKVWKHYYAMPADIWRPELVECLPNQNSGVLLLKEQCNASTPIVVSCWRRAKPNRDAPRLTPEHAIDIARLANLRMWQAYDEAAAVGAHRACPEAVDWGMAA